ncbi:MAG: hypothetical protein QT11_C0001G0697 [archaeon GW2011_AR20]|nr:MAG: hypothetical protein QT11_C0001G0697 [archaeon GW2011_AR20]MBS3160966.1 hypothetical protein [Candidatus Woesearchaeota archaeon]
MGNKILCICLEGRNRSRYLAKYLKRKGYSTNFGGVKEGAEKPVLQKDIDNADLIICARNYIKGILEERYNIKNKKFIVLNVSDVAKEYGNEAVKLFEKQGEEMFQVKYVRPNLRKQIKEHLCV